MFYNQILTTEQLIEEIKKFKWVRIPKELQMHHTWKPTVYSFNKAVEKYGVPKAYTVLNDSMKNSHINTYGGTQIGQHLTLFPDGKWAVGRNWNNTPISIADRNGLGFAVEIIGNFDIKGLSSTSENSLGYDVLHGSSAEKEFVKFSKYFFEYFKMEPKTALVPHSKYSYKTCPGNGVSVPKILELIMDVKVDSNPRPQAFINIVFGDKGARVLTVQNMLIKLGYKIEADQSFGNATKTAVINFQKSNNITQSGIIDITTYEKLETKSKAVIKSSFKTMQFGMVNDDVFKLQEMLVKLGYPIVPDKSFGNATKNVILDYQIMNNLNPDGIVTEAVYNSIKKSIDNLMIDLKLGSKGTSVKYLQSLLSKLGYPLTIDGEYGNITTNIVKTFQKAYGLAVNGVVTISVWNKLLTAISNNKSIWKTIRMFESDVHYAVLPRDKYFVGFTKGNVGLEKTSKIVNDNIKAGMKPVAAINCGFFGGSIEQIGLELVNGSYRSKPNADHIDLLYTVTGKFLIDNWDENTPNIWNNRNLYHWGCGTSYSLIQDGIINLENVAKYTHAYQYNPRTMVGQCANGDILFVVVDGRSNISRGVTAPQQAEIMQHLKTIQAVNLDGGGSTVGIEVVNGAAKVVNKPCDITGERVVGSILVAYAL
jgi:peptidoglycan hydrolase-like protein with peptidoglycan-binding domain